MSVIILPVRRCARGWGQSENAVVGRGGDSDKAKERGVRKNKGSESEKH